MTGDVLLLIPIAVVPYGIYGIAFPLPELAGAGRCCVHRLAAAQCKQFTGNAPTPGSMTLSAIANSHTLCLAYLRMRSAHDLHNDPTPRVWAQSVATVQDPYRLHLSGGLACSVIHLGSYGERSRQTKGRVPFIA